ncbi:hypothetical protein JM83_2907 [Gillisia sp. Hel_I_86]|uniref:hypothetical protein n=1 Tax=Gillisia sp. Hel_I_86 TaxID=1249981 RepID=UPI00119B7E48|nr:hypothetical protein [Gillisia sp. Hel_I_86]TVZ27842.1 hypothetical protein JM83_2907 [Gillisia sp. Hel_I_86]
MKKLILFIICLSLTQTTYSQLLPGTLDVSGMPNFIQSIDDVVMEAGLDDTAIGFESNFDATLIGFVLNPQLLLSSEIMCETNVFRYSVYIHTTNAPVGLTLEAKTTFNSGMRFPTLSTYDLLPLQPLGPRDLTPSNGGSYITVPNMGSQAIKIFEFIGCRTDIPIQFKIKASALVPGTPSNFDIYYTVVGSLM